MPATIHVELVSAVLRDSDRGIITLTGQQSAFFKVVNTPKRGIKFQPVMLSELIMDKVVNVTLRFTKLSTQQTQNKVIKISISSQK